MVMTILHKYKKCKVGSIQPDAYSESNHKTSRDRTTPTAITCGSLLNTYSPSPHTALLGLQGHMIHLVEYCFSP